MIYSPTNRNHSANRGVLRRLPAGTHHPALRAVELRLLTAVPLLFIATALSFVLLALTPGDAARQILGIEATPQSVLQLRHSLGLDQSVVEQYWRWLHSAVRGDLGSSFYTGQSVTQAIDQRLPVTGSLIVGAMLVTILVGIPLGTISAIRGGALGRLLDASAITAFALPPFWLGAALIALFAVRLGWFPAVGYVPLTQSPKNWFLSLVLPVIALSIYGIASVAKQTRTAMLDALSSEYTRAAWATGISPRSIVWRYAFRNAAMSVLTVLGLHIVGLLGGTIFVEAVFGLPGLGGLAASSAQQHDFPMLEGVVVYFTVIVIVVNLAIDVAYGWLNPRITTT
jgi:peptide/nickel transport system permease protein